MIRQPRWSLTLVAALLFAGCDMDLTDPNNPNEGEAIGTAAGLRQIGVGLQAEYSNELVDPVYIAGLVTDEIGAIPQAFESYRRVDAGLSVGNELGPSTETWGGMYDVVQVANVLLDNVPLVSTLQPGTASGLIALAKFYKAIAFGGLLQTYERIPLDVGLHNVNPEFATRQEGLATVLTLLNEARTQLQTTPPSAEFNNTVLAPGFSLANSIDAMIARYALIAGDLTQALQASQRVNRSILSEFRFAESDANPIWTMFYASGNAFRLLPEDSFRLNAQPGDQRVAYWVSDTAVVGSTGAGLDNAARYRTRERSFPVYLPDEMLLIQAEVHARQNNLVLALDALNAVRTQCSSPLNEPVACLPPLTLAQVPTQQAMLDAILLEREYELFLQGVRWSDLRRFGKPVKYNFMMVSRGECDGNENAPAELCQVETPPAN